MRCSDRCGPSAEGSLAQLGVNPPDRDAAAGMCVGHERDVMDGEGQVDRLVACSSAEPSSGTALGMIGTRLGFSDLRQTGRIRLGPSRAGRSTAEWPNSEREDRRVPSGSGPQSDYARADPCW